MCPYNDPIFGHQKIIILGIEFAWTPFILCQNTSGLECVFLETKDYFCGSWYVFGELRI